MAAYCFNGTVSQTYTGGSSFQALTPAETLDTHGFHDPVTNPTRLTIPVAGRYYLWGTASLPSTHSGRTTRWLKNGATVLFVNQQGANSATVGIESSGVAVLAAGDYIELQFAGSGGANAGTAGAMLLMRMPAPLFVGGGTNVIAATPVDLAEVVDDGGWHSDSTNPSRVTVPTNGNYLYAAWGRTTSGTLLTNTQVLVNSVAVHEAKNVNRNSSNQGATPMMGVLALTAGDIIEIQADATGGIVQLALASIDGGVRCAHAVQTVAITMVPGDTLIALQSETVDTNGYHDNAVNNSRMTIPASQDGIYMALAQAEHQGFVSMGAEIRLNLASLCNTHKVSTTNIGANGNQIASASAGWIASLVAGDFYDSRGYNDSAGSFSSQPAGTRLCLVCPDDFVYETPSVQHLLPLLGVGA